MIRKCLITLVLVCVIVLLSFVLFRLTAINYERLPPSAEFKRNIRVWWDVGRMETLPVYSHKGCEFLVYGGERASHYQVYKRALLLVPDGYTVLQVYEAKNLPLIVFYSVLVFIVLLFLAYVLALYLFAKETGQRGQTAKIASHPRTGLCIEETPAESISTGSTAGLYTAGASDRENRK